MGAAILKSSVARPTLPPFASPGVSVNFDPLVDIQVPEGQHRLFHGRGGLFDGLDWLTVDRFPPVLVATIHDDPGDAILTRLEQLLEAQLSRLGCDCLVFQYRFRHPVENRVCLGELPAQPVAREAGLEFLLDFRRGQNLGFFPDMQPARQWLAARAAERNILNLFSFTCAFSVVAVTHGARQVVNIDLSEAALGIGQANHSLNGLDDGHAIFLPHNVFRSWKKLHRLGRYELVIMDPPSEQKGSFMARKDYAGVMRQLHRLLAPQADLLACLNAPWLDEAFLDRAVLDNLAGSEKVERLPLAPGYLEPDRDAALKVVHYRYQRPAGLGQ